MLRFTIIEILIVSAPIATFLLYRALVRARRRHAGPDFDPAPYRLLFLIGAIASVAALIAAVLTRPAPNVPADAVYVPSHLENGELVPPRYKPAKEEPAPAPPPPGSPS